MKHGGAVAAKPAIPARRALHPRQELLVAWLLLLLDYDGIHGYRLSEELQARGLDFHTTRMYRMLRSFEEDGWVASRWVAPVAGPRRRVYSLTKQGRSALHDAGALITATRKTYDTFLDAHRHAVAQRVNAPNALDAAALPPPQVSSATPERAPVQAVAASGTQALRPHKELLVGWLLLRLDAGPTYGYDLRREFAARQLAPDPPALYRMLRKLEADKWVQSRWLRPSAGPRRRFYRLTGRGRRNLDEIAGVITAIRDLHDDYLHEYDEHARQIASGRRQRRTSS